MQNDIYSLITLLKHVCRWIKIRRKYATIKIAIKIIDDGVFFALNFL